MKWCVKNNFKKWLNEEVYNKKLKTQKKKKRISLSVIISFQNLV